MKRWRWAILTVVLLLHAGALAALRAVPSASAPVVAPPVFQIDLMAETMQAPAAPQPPAGPLPKRAPVKAAPRPKPVPGPAPASPTRTAPQQASPSPVAEASTASSPQAQAAETTPSPPPVREPAAISCRTPAYPSEARRRRETGTVLLGLLVDVDGTVTDRRIEQSSGFGLLDEAALTALSRCKFTPGTVDGRAQAAWARLRYVWKLE